jgi:hypothetical protein
LAKRSKHSFIKFRKEIERKKKAEEKMSRRQGKKENGDDVDATDETPETQASDERHKHPDASLPCCLLHCSL